MKNYLNVFIVLIVIGLAVFGTYYFSNYLPKPDSSSKAVPGVVFDTYLQDSLSENDPAFFDASYQKTSSMPLYKNEHTVTYTYPSSPCGTLTTQFSEIGSVRVGRGPVYNLAKAECQATNTSYVPNDFSFRVYSCQNVSASSVIQGKATFAFQCSPDGEDARCSQARISGAVPQQDWNCAGI